MVEKPVKRIRNRRDGLISGADLVAHRRTVRRAVASMADAITALEALGRHADAALLSRMVVRLGWSIDPIPAEGDNGL